MKIEIIIHKIHVCTCTCLIDETSKYLKTLYKK